MSTFFFQPGCPTKTQAVNLGPLALWAPLLEQLNLAALIDQHLPTQAEFSHGRVLTALVAARLHQPTALVHVAAWARQHGAELLFGIPAAKLNDDRLGRALDAFFEQRQASLASLALHVAATFDLPLDTLHYDPTALHFCGAYVDSQPCGVKADVPTVRTVRADPDRDDPAHITYGHTSTKQRSVHAGIAAVVDDLGAVPIFGHVTSGNHNGHSAVAEMFEQWQKYLQPKRLMLLSDRGTYSLGHVRRLHAQGFHLLCPAPWDDFHHLYQQHRAGLHWRTASYLSQEQQRRRRTNSRLTQDNYRLAVLKHTLVEDQTQTAIPCRLIFVHSSAQTRTVRQHRARRLKKLLRKLKVVQANVARGHSRTDADTIRQTITKLLADQSVATLIRWHFEPLTAQQQAALPNPKPGCRRPTYRVVVTVDRQALHQQMQVDGLSVLVTTAPPTQSADALFRHYKKQIYVEQAHHQWKTPLAVRPVFVQTPQRVEALVYLLLIALMAWHLLQRHYRSHVPPQAAATEQRMTSERLVRAFAVVLVQQQRQSFGWAVQVLPLTAEQRDILGRLNYPTPAQTFARRFPRSPP